MVASDLREIERKVVSQKAMLRARFFQRNVVVRFRKFLKIIQVVNHRIVIVLGQSGLEEMQDDLGVFRIVLIPRVVHGFSGACQSEGGNELKMKPFGVEEVSKRPVVVARRFETNPNGQRQTVQKLCKGTKFLGCVLHTKLLSTLPSGCFDESFVAILGDIDSYPDNGFRHTLRVGHGWSVSFGEY